MLLDIVFVLLGLVGLFFGGEWLVRGASRLAASFGVEPLIIGLTVVAFGTSMPELLVNLSAAAQGSTDLALGNVVGSNIANIGLILGITGLIYPITVKSILVRRELPILFVVTLAGVLLAVDGQVSRTDGLLMVIGFLTFNAFMGWQTLREREHGPINGAGPAETPERSGRAASLALVVLGIVLLGVGANFMVTGATNIAREVGVSELVISVTLVAFGTSLPELAASVIAALRQQSDIALGNVIGSNIANVLLILGATSLVLPIPVPDAVIGVQFPALLAFTVLLFPFALNRILSRRESALYIVSYAAFIALTVIVS